MKREKPLLMRVRVIDDDGNEIFKTMRHDSIERNESERITQLTADERVRVKTIYDSVGKAICKNSFEEFIANFERDVHPGNEIDVWEKIAQATDILQQQPEAKSYKRQKIARVVLAHSAQVIDVPEIFKVDERFSELAKAYYLATWFPKCVRIPEPVKDGRLIMIPVESMLHGDEVDPDKNPCPAIFAAEVILAVYGHGEEYDFSRVLPIYGAKTFETAKKNNTPIRILTFIVRPDTDDLAIVEACASECNK